MSALVAKMKRSKPPGAASGATATVSVLDVVGLVTTLGSSVAVTPVGTALKPSVTLPLLLPCRAMLTVTVLDWPSPTLSVVADSESETKFGSSSVDPDPSPPLAHDMASWANTVNVAQRPACVTDFFRATTTPDWRLSSTVPARPNT
jgi:hypothetical protein